MICDGSAFAHCSLPQPWCLADQISLLHQPSLHLQPISSCCHTTFRCLQHSRIPTTLGTLSLPRFGYSLKKRKHFTGNKRHFLTIHAGCSKSSHSAAVLFHPLLETNGSRKIDKSEAMQLLLLDIFSSNWLGEEGVTRKWHFDQTRCFHSKFSF